MKIAVWRTGHEIADTVAEAVVQCFRTEKRGSNLVHSFGSSIADCAELHHTDEIINGLPDADIHIGYGILRGIDEVFRACDNAKKPWFNIDKGYWKPGHYDGYYRISLRGTQQTLGLDKLKPDYERWDKLRLEIENKPQGDTALICPPTHHVMNYFGLNDIWSDSVKEFEYVTRWGKHIIRHKGNEEPIDWQSINQVVTFNSSVGWGALRQGIPVMSDPTHSIVGAYQKMLDKSIHDDSNARRELFALMAGLQLSLSEIKSGALWPLLQNLLTIN